MANCLFCASVVPTTYTIDGDGEVKRTLKVGENQKSSGAVSSGLVFSVGEKDGSIVEHLNTFFILRKLLKIPSEFLAKFLSLCDGDSHPELWVNVCEKCMQPVSQFYETVNQISKLERNLDRIADGLREEIRKSEEVQGGGPIWKGLRSEALKVQHDKPPDSVPIPLSLLNERLHLQNEEMEITEDPLSTENIQIQLKRINEEDDDDDDVQLEFFDEDESSPTQSMAATASEQPCPNIEFIDLVDSDDDDASDLNHSELPSPPPSSISPVLQEPSLQVKRTRVRRVMDNSNPNFIAYSIGDKRFFECRQCSYYGQRPEQLRRHLLVHEEGAQTVRCKECFWHVRPEKLSLHYRLHHPGLSPPPMRNQRHGKNKSSPDPPTIFDLIVNKYGPQQLNFKCSECEASFKCLEACKAHAKRHIKPAYDWC